MLFFLDILQEEVGAVLSPVTQRSREEMSSTVQLMRHSRGTEQPRLLPLIQQLPKHHRLNVRRPFIYYREHRVPRHSLWPLASLSFFLTCKFKEKKLWQTLKS